MAMDSRLHSAALFRTWTLPIAATAPRAGVEALDLYHKEVREKGKGHGLGAPAPHAAMAILEKLAATLKGLPDESAFMKLLLAALHDPQGHMLPAKVNSIIPVLVARKISPEAGECTEENHHYLVTVKLEAVNYACCGPVVGVEVVTRLRELLAGGLEKEGGAVSIGGPPPSPQERRVRSDMRGRKK